VVCHSNCQPSASTPSDILCYTPLAAGPATPDSVSNIQSVARSPASQAHNLPLGTQETSPAHPNSIRIPNSPAHLGPVRDAPYGHSILPISSVQPALSPSVCWPNLTPVLSPLSYTALPEWSHDNWQVNFDGAGTPANMFNFTLSDQGNGPGISFNPALIEMNAPLIQLANDDSELLFDETQNDSTINPIEGEQVMPESTSEIGVEIVASNDLVMSLTPEDENAISLLRENGFDFLAKNIDEGKCLTWAAEEGHEAVLRLLLKGGADINARDVHGRTALEQAVLEGKDEILLFLLKEGANIECQNNNGETALTGAAFFAEEKAARLLLEYGADVHTPDNSGWTALHCVTLFGSEAIARLLIEKGADVNALDHEGMRPLHGAARHGHEELVKLLLTNGSEVNAQSNTKFTALHNATINGYRNTMELLIEHRADINAKDDGGKSVLWCAALTRQRTAVRILITKQADLKAKDNDGWTVLHAAVGLHDKGMMLLYENNLKHAAEDEDEMARIHWKMEHGHEAVVRLILEQDSSELNSKTKEG
jgi:ankyrin repeat protein